MRIFETVIEGNADDYVAKVKGGHDPFDDLTKMATLLADRPPKTATTYMAGVKSFLEFSLDYSLSRKQMKLLRNKLPRGKRARTVEDDLTREKLRQILTHCDAKGKALFLLLESSGLAYQLSLS